MKELYIKTLLYIYPKISLRIKSIEEESIKLGLNSMWFGTLETIERMCYLYDEKRILLKVDRVINLIKSRLPPERISLLEYKYFRTDNSKPDEDFDYTSRTYFHRQKSLLKRLSSCFDLCGFTDEIFEKECLKFEVIRSRLNATQTQRFINKDSYIGERKWA